jgi:hypothetical protein
MLIIISILVGIILSYYFIKGVAFIAELSDDNVNADGQHNYLNKVKGEANDVR